MAPPMVRLGLRLFGFWRGAVAAGVLAAAAPAAAQTSLLLADDSKRPQVTVSWPTADGKTVTLKGERPYRSPGDKSRLGRNVDCYVALGGTRLDKGLANGKGAVVRMGLYKADASKLFFENIAEGATVTLTVDRVFMNQPAVPRPKTGLMHLRYGMGDLTACGLGGDARNLFVTVDPEDPVRAGISAASGRFGSLDGAGPEHGRVSTVVNEDGSVTITFAFPYVLLRHVKDPYLRSTPGGFFEPEHFHVEMELLPRALAEAEDGGAGKQEPPATPPAGKPEPKPADEPKRPV